MPGISRGLKAEAKYNVTLDFPHLGLHSAASSGDIGLVKYALEHGQPINSALDGVLPLHAACSGGSDIVVRLLIDRGADVNAPRLPRRYSSDKNRDTSAPIVGSSGSTPLHFACANGHINVVTTLLMHGAHPDRPDKHGVTPEMLARQKGFAECADVLKQWSHNKDKDLRDREDRITRAYSDNSNQHQEDPHHSHPHPQRPQEKESHSYCGQLDCKDCSNRKRLRVKQSIDNALHIFRPSLSISSTPVVSPPSTGPSTSSGPEHTRDTFLPSSSSVSISGTTRGPFTSTSASTPSTSATATTTTTPSPTNSKPQPLGEYSFYPPPESASASSSSLFAMGDYPRRPSLPHLFEHQHVQRNGSQRRPSAFGASSSSSGRVRRPRSAGNGAEASPSSSSTQGRFAGQIQVSHSHPPTQFSAHGSGMSSTHTLSQHPQGTGTPNKVKSKLSLLNIFKKNSSDAVITNPSTSGVGDSGFASVSSSSIVGSTSPSPAPDMLSGSASYVTHPQSFTPASGTPSRTGSYPSLSPRHKRSVDALTHAHMPERFRNRLASDGGIGITQAVELHHALSRDSLRGRFKTQSGPSPSSGQQAPGQSQSPSQSQTHAQADTPPQSVKRPGILKTHGRSSSGNSQSQSPSRAAQRETSLNQQGDRSGSVQSGSVSPGVHPLSLSHSPPPNSNGNTLPTSPPMGTRALRFDSSSTTSSQRSRGIVFGDEKGSGFRERSLSRNGRRGESRSPVRVLREVEGEVEGGTHGVLRSEPEEMFVGGFRTSPLPILGPGSSTAGMGDGDDVLVSGESGVSPRGVFRDLPSAEDIQQEGEVGVADEEDEEYGKVVKLGMGELSLEDNRRFGVDQNSKQFDDGRMNSSRGGDAEEQEQEDSEGQEEEGTLGRTPEEDLEGPLTHVFDCPFSINCPPLTGLEPSIPAGTASHPFHSHHLLHQHQQHPHSHPQLPSHAHSSQQGLNHRLPLLHRQDPNIQLQAPHAQYEPEFLGIDSLEAQGRTRGDSMSSMITDTSSISIGGASGNNPPSSSSTSGFIDTPALEMRGLPLVDVSEGAGGLDAEGVEPQVEDVTEKEGKGVIEIGMGEVVEVVPSSPPDVVTNTPASHAHTISTDSTVRLPHKRSRVPLDIDIRSISSHAQAEALVQAAQQRILDFENSPVDDDETMEFNGLGLGGLGSGSGLGEGRTPLSARLAAYGESLSIERRFKEEEEKRRSPGFVSGGLQQQQQGGAPSLMSLSPKSGVFGMSPSPSASASQTRVVLSPSKEASFLRGREDGLGGMKKSRVGELGLGYGPRGVGAGLDRKFSLEERARASSGKGRPRKMKRPHTASGTPLSDPPSSIFGTEQTSQTHHYSSSFSAITTSSTSNLRGSPSTKPRILVASITPPSSNYLKVRADTFPIERPSLPLARSRTPDPTSTTSIPHSKSNSNSNPNSNTNSNSDLFGGGVPLSRYSTTPDDVFGDDRLGVGGRGALTKEEREVARVSKLTKMGFAAGAGEAWQGGHSGGHSGSGKQRHRFGIRTLVQSLTGKS